MPNNLTNLNIAFLPRSLVSYAGVEYGLINSQAGIKLVIRASPTLPVFDLFEGEHVGWNDQTLFIGPLNPHNAAALRAQIPWLRPTLLSLRTSAGMGDRLGLATPGHVRAIRSARTELAEAKIVPGDLAPIFAQQSIREMTRTGRTPQQVMDDATWGIFAEGWQGGVGADADHLKTPADIDLCLAAGFSFFTIDPGEYVDASAEIASLSTLRELAEKLPVDLQPRASGLLNQRFNIEGRSLYFDEPTLLKAVVKYGRAVSHVSAMYQHLIHAAGQQPYELEVSVDETEQPTTHAEHLYIASELRRLGVEWISLAPRLVGRFEKGADYIGDLTAFEDDIAGHAAIARQFGPYKLSLHSGSDKFSIYPAAMQQTGGLIHLKTAGTSYLEALRTIAVLDVDLFDEIYAFARGRYETDRASYHVSAELVHAPLPQEVANWPRDTHSALLDQFDAREILHVTYGSILTERNSSSDNPLAEDWRFYDRIMALLKTNPDAYAANLERHFARHLKPFMSPIIHNRID